MLEKLLQLAKEEGGKAFVMNETTGEMFCVMPLETYREMKRGITVVKSTPTLSPESVASLSEEELLRKINREIAIWREQQQDKAEIILPARHASPDGYRDVAGGPSREDRDGVPEVKKIAKDFPKAEIKNSLSAQGLEQPLVAVAKAPILETEEEFFLEMA